MCSEESGLVVESRNTKETQRRRLFFCCFGGVDDTSNLHDYTRILILSLYLSMLDSQR